MKQIVKYKFLSIPHKLTGEVRLMIENRSVVYNSVYEGGRTTNISMTPIVILSITRDQERTEDGRYVRQPWDPNDSIPLTRYHIPLLLQEMKSLYKDIQIPEMYTYHGKRLELDEKLAAKARKVFVIGSVTVELVPVVIQRNGDDSIEGIKMKFNNESYIVIMTLNEFYSFIYQLDNLNLDALATWMYDRYIDIENKETTRHTPRVSQAIIDIEPKSRIDSIKSTSEFDNL